MNEFIHYHLWIDRTFARMISRPLILFDGVCNFCNGAVNFIIKRGKNSQLKFCPIQSNTGQQLLKEYGLPGDYLNSFIFIERNQVFTHSTAALKVCRHLRGLWPLLYGFIIVPKFIRDSFYNWVARNRYKWFGKREQCMIPTADTRRRFL
jgi:predicted DCC family thiol-disulfide oxidoreductase YuxK